MSDIKYVKSGLLNDTRLEKEINDIIKRLVNYIDFKFDNINIETSSNLKTQTTNLVNSILTPLLARSGETSSILQTFNTSGVTISVSQIPDLPTSKITTGNFIKGRMPNDTIYSNMTRTPGVPVAGGTVTISDNNGNSHTFLVV